MPDKVYKSDDVQDDQAKLTIKQLGPEEKFAGNVLKSLKDQISEARETIQELEEEIEEKREQARTEKKEILEEARAEADRIRSEAEAEAEEILESTEEQIQEARDEGYQDGYEDGKEEARREMADFLEQAESILSEAKRERDSFLAERMDQVVTVAGRLAEKIVRDTIEFDESVVKRVVDSALKQINEVREINLVLNPDDAETIEEVRHKFREEHPNLEDIQISEDPKMDRGGCKIRTSFGDLDGTIQGQIEHLTETFLDEFDTSDTSSNESN